jgi:hypothetical protein
VIETDRLVLRRFVPDDIEWLAPMLGDPATLEHWDRPLTHAESVQWIDRNLERYAADGYGLWVVEHDGKPVRRLVREQKIGLRMQQRFVFYMDPQTFAPLGGRMYFTLNRKRRFMSEFTISTYERIPLTDESKQLLHFDKTPSTKYVWHDIRKPRGKVKPAVRVG